MEEIKTARNHKDSVFTSLFSDKRRLLELYNAIEGTSYSDPDMISINTLSNVLFLSQQNDISFTIGDKLVVLVEHQSSINENMPLRGLIYVGRVYERMLAPENIHRRRLIKIPNPEFIVLYNGKDEYPDEKILKLSDAFRMPEELKGKMQLDLHVRVLNINKGRNSWISEKSESLLGYSEFIAKIREFASQGLESGEAMKNAISYCMGNNILLDYLRDNASEIENMIFHEFKMEEAQAIWREEGKAEGLQEVLALFEQGLSLEEVKAKYKDLRK